VHLDKLDRSNALERLGRRMAANVGRSGGKSRAKTSSWRSWRGSFTHLGSW